MFSRMMYSRQLPCFRQVRSEVIPCRPQLMQIQQEVRAVFAQRWPFFEDTGGVMPLIGFRVMRHGRMRWQSLLRRQL